MLMHGAGELDVIFILFLNLLSLSKRLKMIKEEYFKELLKFSDIDVASCINNLRSMSKTIFIYEYHKSEAYKIIKDIDPKTYREAMELVFLSSKDVSFKKLAAQAHIQSAIYNSRALYDIFSHLINKVFLKGSVSVDSCSIDKVKSLLCDGVFKTSLISAINTDSYFYVNSFVNTIKHRDLVGMTSSIDFLSDRSGIKFNGFKYNKKDYESLWAIEVLSHSLNVKNNVIDLFDIFKRELVNIYRENHC